MPSQRAGRAQAFAATGITGSQWHVSCTALDYVRLWPGLRTLSVTSDKENETTSFFKLFFWGGQFGHQKWPWGSVAEALQEAAQSPAFPTLRQGTAERSAAVRGIMTPPGCCCSHRSGLSARSVPCLLSGIPALKKLFGVFFLLRINFCFLKYCSSDLGESCKLISARCCWGHVKPYFWFCLWIRAGLCLIFKKNIYFMWNIMKWKNLSDRHKDPPSCISIPVYHNVALILSIPKCLQYYGALKGILCDFIEWWLLSAKIMDIIRAFSIFTTSKYSHSKYSYCLCVWLDCPVACFMESEDEIVFVKRHELLMKMNFRDKLSCNHWLFHSMEIWKELYINLTKNCFFLGNSSPALSKTAIAAFLH